MKAKFSPFHLFPLILLAAIILVGAASAEEESKAPVGTPQDVLTYHGDNLRTGWFSSETVLNTSNVNAQQFGLLQVVPLDGRVDGEPLITLQQAIQGQGVHNVVYVATENNSVYAIDADTGAILWQQNFGAPAPDDYKDTDTVFPVVGIVSTPVIDRTSGVIYVVADVYNGSTDAFQLHALSLSNGKDLGHITIQFSAPLQDGTTWTFNPQYDFQRPGLLEANGNIYVAIGSNGDFNPDVSRGALVVYNAATGKKLVGGIVDRLSEKSSPPSDFYMSSIWMSGYGPAADASGDIYFATGNSDPTHPTYGTGNLPESVLRMSGDLKMLHSSFTPFDYFQLDQSDLDVSSGGVVLLPDQSGSIPHLALASAKWGQQFLLNRDKLGGFTNGGPDKIVQTLNTIGSCWCGPAYFVGSDGIPRVLTGGAAGITSYQLQTSPSTQLVFDSTTGPNFVNGLPDDGGAIPVVSSNGTTPGSAIVWFVQRPATSSDQDPGTAVTLHAFAGSDLTQELFSTQAGTWVHAVNSNANLVPTVSNGKVYVASNKQLQIYGLLSTLPASKRASLPTPPTPSEPAVITCPPEVAPSVVLGKGTETHKLRGHVCALAGNQLRVALPGRQSISIDISKAAPGTPLLTLGRPIKMQVSLDEKGVAHAQRISRGRAISGITN